MDAAPRPGRVAEAALLAGVGIVLAWAVLFGHGSRDGALATAGIAAIAASAVRKGMRRKKTSGTSHGRMVRVSLPTLRGSAIREG